MRQDALTDRLRAALEALQATESAALDDEQRTLLAALARHAGATPRPASSPRDQALRIHFEYALHGIVESDGDGRILDANPAAASILGRERKHLSGANLQDILTLEASDRLARHLVLLREQGINHVELSGTGSEHGQTLTLASVQVEENLYLHAIDDVTAERVLSRELQAARQSAESANAAKSRFLASVSHEIRTPLNGIIGLAQLALLHAPDPRHKDYLDKIAQSGKTLSALINDLLDFAKIEAGKMALEERRFDWFALLDELSSVGLDALSRKPVELIFDLAPEVSRYQMGDPLRLVQILSNLLGNAAKFTAEGQIVLRIEAATPGVLITVSDTGPGIQPEQLERLFQPFVQESLETTRRYGGTGLGLSISRQLAIAMGGTLDVVSTPGAGSVFRLRLPLGEATPALDDAGAAVAAAWPVLALRVDSACHRAALEHLAAHLGLALAEAAEAQVILQLSTANAALPMAPSPGKRTCLVVPACRRPEANTPESLWATADVLTLPLTPNALRRALLGQGTPMPQAIDPIDPADLPTEFRGACIAVAEDMPVNQQVICGLLERIGVKVLLADNGRHLLAQLEDTTTVPELFLMDIHMDELDGLETTRQLRERGFSQPIVALSAGIGKDAKAQCLASGMNDFLAKPIDVDELWGVLTCWLPPRQSSHPASLASTLPEPARANDDGQLEALRQAGINIGEMTARYLGDHAAIARGIALFCSQHADTLLSMNAAIEQNDQSRFTYLAHALRGTALTIGAETLATLSGAAEHLPANEWSGAAAALMPDIAEAYARIAVTQAGPR